MLYFIPTPIGNLEDITVRALNTLKVADIIFCEDTRVTKKLLKLLEEKFSLLFKVEKFISMHSHNEDRVIETLDISMFDKNIVFMSDAGMPCISDPGVKFVRFALENGIKYEVLPGPNAAVTAYAASGLEEKEFLFYGFLPHKNRERVLELERVLTLGYNIIIYESPKRVIKLLLEIEKISPDATLFMQKEITKMHEKSYLGNPGELLKRVENENLNGEWVFVIKSKKTKTQNITKDEILQLDLPKKQKAKLLSKITGEDIKNIYNSLINS